MAFLLALTALRREELCREDDDVSDELFEDPSPDFALVRRAPFDDSLEEPWELLRLFCAVPLELPELLDELESLAFFRGRCWLVLSSDLVLFLVSESPSLTVSLLRVVCVVWTP
jgi:hypothetical protein